MQYLNDAETYLLRHKTEDASYGDWMFGWDNVAMPVTALLFKLTNDRTHSKYMDELVESWLRNGKNVQYTQKVGAAAVLCGCCCCACSAAVFALLGVRQLVAEDRLSSAMPNTGSSATGRCQHMLTAHLHLIRRTMQRSCSRLRLLCTAATSVPAVC
jgi:hypothetical protein